MPSSAGRPTPKPARVRPPRNDRWHRGRLESAVVARFVGSGLRSADLARRPPRRPGPRLALGCRPGLEGNAPRAVDIRPAVRRRSAPGRRALGDARASEHASSAVGRVHQPGAAGSTRPEALRAMPTGSREFHRPRRLVRHCRARASAGAHDDRRLTERGGQLRAAAANVPRGTSPSPQRHRKNPWQLRPLPEIIEPLRNVVDRHSSSRQRRQRGWPKHNTQVADARSQTAGR